jgi:crossover junction endodeoxyribonuclease RuvC
MAKRRQRNQVSQRDSAVRILGVDPGLRITGYGLVEFRSTAAQVVEAGTLRTEAKADMAERIASLYADLSELLRELSPDVVAIEQLYAHYKHPRTAILMGHARGVILLAAQQAGLVVRHLAATHVKKSLTGNGHASKAQVQRTIQAVCNLAAPPEPPDVADALAIALCAGRHTVGLSR